MKIAAVIAEYNPFHNGHEYMLRRIKQDYGYDYIVVIMSGDFVQRGECALLDKYTRTRMALSGGSDLCIELPVIFATGSAEYFAEGAISILNGLGCIDTLFFGAEYDNPEYFQKIAGSLVNEPDDYRSLFENYMKQGLSVPSARARALKSHLNLSDAEADALSSSNNILAIEYYKAAIRLNSKYNLIPILRNDDGYHGSESAEAIRHRLVDDNDYNLSSLPMPEASKHLLQNALKRNSISHLNMYRSLIRYAIAQNKYKLFTYLDCNKDIANKLINHLTDFSDTGSYIKLLKSKDITYTRLSRILIHILLGIDSERANIAKNSPDERYARILGFSENAKNGLLSTIKKAAIIPLISKPSDFRPEGISAWMYELDIYAADLFENVLCDITGGNIIPDIIRTPNS